MKVCKRDFLKLFGGGTAVTAVAVASGAKAVFEMFVVPLGQICPWTGRRKTSSDTNMDCAGRLPTPRMFWTRRIHIVLLPDLDQEAAHIATEYAWQFRLGAKTYQDGTLLMDAQIATRANVRDELCPAGRLATTRRSLELDASNGLFIPSQMSFRMELQSQREHRLCPAGTGLDFLMALEGVEARPVQ